MALHSPSTDLLPRHSLIIGDKKMEGGGGPTWAHVYPATGAVTRELRLANASDVDAAVKAARTAFPAWRALAGDKRRDLMFKLAGLFERDGPLLAQLATIETGNSIMTTGFL